MKSASTTTHTQHPDTTHPTPTSLPDYPPNDLTAGIDWASHDHAIAIVNGRGRVTHRSIVDHSTAGLRDLVETLHSAGCAEAAIERGDGPVVDALLTAGVRVVVISPNQVKNLRSRYGSAGNKDDRHDAFVLADTLRGDRARLRPLTPDSPATATLRRTSRARQDLVGHRVAAANQLRAHLRHALPGAIGLFHDLDSPISLAFLTRFTTQDAADWLTPARLARWLASARYSGRASAQVLHARLTAAPRGPGGPDAEHNAAITMAYVQTLTGLRAQITALDAQLHDQLAAHADAHIFTSLPRVADIRAARLLSEIGDCRAKFPTPQSLIGLAGVAPSTRQSGKARVVGFRWSCDKQLRAAVTDFADGSRHANAWAADIYTRARNRDKDHAHAIRILSRAWLYIIWRAWQDHTPYDPARHRKLQQLITTQHTPNQAGG